MNNEMDLYLDKVKEYIIAQESYGYEHLMNVIDWYMDSHSENNLLHNNVRGVCAELAVFYTLSQYRAITNLYSSLHTDLVLTKDEGNKTKYTNETDCILCTSKAIFVIEVKSYRGNLVINKNGTIDRKSGTLKPFEQNIKHCETVYNHLYKYFPNGQTDYIINLVVIYGNCKIQDTRVKIDKYITTLQYLPNMIEALIERNKKLKPLDLSRICTYLDVYDKGKTHAGRNEHIRRCQSVSNKSKPNSRNR